MPHTKSEGEIFVCEQDAPSIHALKGDYVSREGDRLKVVHDVPVSDLLATEEGHLRRVGPRRSLLHA